MNNIPSFIDTADSILFIVFLICVVYLFIFSFASLFDKKFDYMPAKKKLRYLVLYPAYAEDNVIIESINCFLKQDYPKNKYDVAVISDHMQEETNRQLKGLPITVLEPIFETSTKAKALNFAIKQMPNDYDCVIILDADNHVDIDFLNRLNDAYSSSKAAIQVRRIEKKITSEISLIDAITEEVNNGIFRSGHVRLGLSSALSGSGMLFSYDWFAKNVDKLKTTGEDKELEVLLLTQRQYIDFLSDVYVYDEKTPSQDIMKKQRKRWAAAKHRIFMTSLPKLPEALIKGNIDFSMKIIQWMIPSMFIQIAGISMIATITTMIDLFYDSPLLCIKWWLLLILLGLTIMIPIPDRLSGKELNKALLKLPVILMDNIKNRFNLGGAHKHFIHTQHGD